MFMTSKALLMKFYHSKIRKWLKADLDRKKDRIVENTFSVCNFNKIVILFFYMNF